jgi:hypothetical protein
MVRPLMRALASCFATLALIVWSATEAHAQQCSNPLTSTCINSDSFWPNAGPQRFAAVGSTETLASGQIGFGLVTSYQSRPVLIHVASPGPGGTDQFAIDNQVNANFLFAYGVTERLQLDLAAPITLVQTGAGTSPLTGGASIQDTAVRDMRFGFAYAIVPRARMNPEQAAEEGGAGKAWSLAGRMTMSAPVGDNNDFAGERTVVFAPAVAADYRVWRFFFAGELGARIRPVTEFAGARVGTQLTTALGGGYDILPDDALSVTLEGRIYPIFAEQHTTQPTATGVASVANGEHITPTEWTLGLRSAPFVGSDLSFFAGGGGPLPGFDGAITVPRFRFLLGINYAPAQRDTDGDGVPDRIDRCPRVRGARIGERPGCPDVPASTSPPATPPEGPPRP